jgi:hypothetical protein
MSEILKAFNDHFTEFVTDVQSVFPNDIDILNAQKYLFLIRKNNPKLLIKIWKDFIADKYREKIERGDLQFFLEKDYSDDIENTNNSIQIMDSINRLRNPIKQMSKENQDKSIKYIQNLTKLCYLYKV